LGEYATPMARAVDFYEKFVIAKPLYYAITQKASVEIFTPLKVSRFVQFSVMESLLTLSGKK
jgi:hypothetical protein